jgi:hypothetical protein
MRPVRPERPDHGDPPARRGHLDSVARYVGQLGKQGRSAQSWMCGRPSRLSQRGVQPAPALEEEIAASVVYRIALCKSGV